MTGKRSAVSDWVHTRGWRGVVIGIPYLWLVLFFLLPFLIVLAMSLARRAELSPPIAFLGEWPYIHWGNFERLFADTLYIRAFLTSLANAATATFFCLLIGYPMALGLTRVSKPWRHLLLMLVVLPFWMSFLLRVYAWMGLLGSTSWFNRGLTAGVNALLPADQALRSIPLMNSNFSVVLVMVYTYLPFMILPLYANLERLDQTLNEAAADLGARRWQVFKDVTFPLSIPGIAAGALLVFIPASGEFIIPGLVGNAAYPMIGRVISDEFFSAQDWPMAAALAVALVLFLVLAMMAYSHFERRARDRWEGLS